MSLPSLYQNAIHQKQKPPSPRQTISKEYWRHLPILMSSTFFNFRKSLSSIIYLSFRPFNFYYEIEKTYIHEIEIAFRISASVPAFAKKKNKINE